MTRRLILTALFATFTSLAAAPAEAQSLPIKSWTENEIGGPVSIFLPQNEPDCAKGYCGFPTSSPSYSSYRDHLNNSGNQLYAFRSGNYHVAVTTKNNQYQTAAFFITPDNKLPVVGRYYEAVGNGGAAHGVWIFRRNYSGNLALVQCPNNAIRKAGFKIERAEGPTGNYSGFVAKYFLNCISPRDGKDLTRFSLEGEVHLSVQAPNATQSELMRSRHINAENDSIKNFALTAARNWFTKYSQLKFK